MADVNKRQDVIINVSPTICLVFAQVLSNNVDGLLQNMSELIGLTEIGQIEITNIIQELHTKSAAICFKESSK